MKRKNLLLIALFLLFLPSIANAVSYIGSVHGTGVYIREDATADSKYFKQASYGVVFDMPNNTLYPDKGKDCPNGWYQVYYNNDDKIGYICSNYLIVNEKVEEVPVDPVIPVEECQKILSEKGFPSSYWDGLCKLMSSHSNWKFNAVNKDKDGNTVSLNAAISAELNNCSNTISNKAKAEYIRGSSTCTNSLDSGYTRASEAAIRYYIDPRNFLDEQNIFMFESQYYNPGINKDSYSNAVKSMFGKSYLVQQIDYLPELIVRGSEDSHLSQTAIASRIKQELGNAKLDYTYAYDNSALYSVVSGNYTSRTGYYYNPDKGTFVKDKAYKSIDNYYNFYNIAATDGSGVTQKALAYAYKKSWGGSGDKRVDRQTALTEGAKWIYKYYTDVGQQTIYFNKFNTFPHEASSRYIHQYMTNIQAPVSESKILYEAYKSLNLLNSPFEFYIPVYNDVNYIPAQGSNDVVDDTKVNVNTAINAAGYKTDNSYLIGIGLNTKASDFINSIKSKGVDVTVSGNIGDIVSTGTKVKIDGSTSETYTVVVYGDVSGDGQINALDLLKIQKHILGITKLSGPYELSADPSHDDSVNALDLLKVQKHILGLSKIEQ